MPKVYIVACKDGYMGSLEDLYCAAKSHWREQKKRRDGVFGWQVGGSPVKTASGLWLAVDDGLIIICTEGGLACKSRYHDGTI
ncbi:MAG: hypothetical protein ACI9SK_002266 [Zhongshania sp.]|jgi:hypothetical protein